MFDGEKGFFGLYGDFEWVEILFLNGWGKFWWIMSLGFWFKVYLFCLVVYYVVDVIFKLKVEYGFIFS